MGLLIEKMSDIESIVGENVEIAQDAQASIQKAVIDAQARVTVARINADPIAAELIAASEQNQG